MNIKKRDNRKYQRRLQYTTPHHIHCASIEKKWKNTSKKILQFAGPESKYHIDCRATNRLGVDKMRRKTYKKKKPTTHTHRSKIIFCWQLALICFGERNSLYLVNDGALALAFGSSLMTLTLNHLLSAKNIFGRHIISPVRVEISLWSVRTSW